MREWSQTQWWIQILKQLGEDRNTHPVPNIIRGHRPEIFFLLVLQTSVWPKIRRKLQLTPTFPPYRPLLRFPTGTLGKITLKASWEFPIKICRDHGIERPFFRDYGIEDLYCFSRQSDLSSNTDEFYSRSRLWTIDWCHDVGKLEHKPTFLIVNRLRRNKYLHNSSVPCCCSIK